MFPFVYVIILWDLILAFRGNDELMLSKARDLIFKKAERMVNFLKNRMGISNLCHFAFIIILSDLRLTFRGNDDALKNKRFKFLIRQRDW